MAEKRMISKVISISKKFNILLNDHFSRLLYLLLIPHSDDFGRLTGDPFKIKALILPMMKEVEWEEVEKTLGNLHAAGLINWYESQGEMYIQIINFDDHQQGLHKRTRSKFPEPPTVSRNFPEIPSEQNRTEGNRTEEKGTEQNGVSSENLILSWINKYQLNCKGTFQLDEICSYLGMMDIEVIELSIKQSEKKSVAYAMTILDRYKREGKTTKESIKQHLQPVPDPKTDKELEARRIEIERNKWIAGGRNPDEFEYRPASND
ncbi:hypothetical protein PAECIP111893_02406 [Paenibacillus plantiphilus]|uniref:DnaD domain-containing protein n=1 Tax=Paenibacillus plantiphilus TaxID=2905650 RepID=A0ABN8GCJ3_9BACL|nr:DNA replication protein DnaD [Paenibacillus plantiphilus]CAH1205739.1 hypothetical protein PAECIP111893_02406 [Paenibacillus plantiphilus]